MEITIDGHDYELHEGESIVMPEKHPHAVFGQDSLKCCKLKIVKIVKI